MVVEKLQDIHNISYRSFWCNKLLLRFVITV